MLNFIKDITGANKALKEANDKLVTLEAELKTAKDLNAEYEKTISAFPLAKADYEKQISDLKADTNAKEEIATKEIEQVKDSVFKEVSAKIASIGIPETAVKEEAQADTRETILGKLTNLKRGSQERADFYKKHKAIITQWPVASK
jgi:septal ring factor EnvC (AmiA/AmiB activator)